MSFLHFNVLAFILGPNIFLSTLFSNTRSLCSFLNECEQVSHPYKTIDKIIVLYVIIFIFLDRKLEDKIFSLKVIIIIMINTIFIKLVNLVVPLRYKNDFAAG